MAEVLKELIGIPFIIGIVVGICAVKIHDMISNKINLSDSIKIFEKILDTYQKNGADYTRKYVSDNNAEFKKYKLWDKFSMIYSSYNVWGMLIIYTAHKFASYDYSEKVGNILDTFASDYFGKCSSSYEKYEEAKGVLNHATMYYTDKGWVKETSKKIDHGGIKDYADNRLYELVYLILDSVYDDTFK